jgi:hypothetical protein
LTCPSKLLTETAKQRTTSCGLIRVLDLWIQRNQESIKHEGVLPVFFSGFVDDETVEKEVEWGYAL